MLTVLLQMCCGVQSRKDENCVTVQLLMDLTISHSPGTAGRIILQHPVHIRDINASGHHICTHQDPTAAKHTDKTLYKSNSGCYTQTHLLYM